MLNRVFLCVKAGKINGEIVTTDSGNIILGGAWSTSEKALGCVTLTITSCLHLQHLNSFRNQAGQKDDNQNVEIARITVPIGSN